jgi:hypothetical protein
MLGSKKLGSCADCSENNGAVQCWMTVGLFSETALGF